MNKIATALALGLALALNTAWAHGDVKPKHGGVAQEAGDLVFELVPQGGSASIYIDDHGTPVKPAGMNGKLTVLQGGQKTDYPITLGVDRLEVAGAKLAKGARAVAVINGVKGKTVTVRFTVK